MTNFKDSESIVIAREVRSDGIMRYNFPEDIINANENICYHDNVNRSKNRR